LLRAIASARYEIFLESYLYRDDATGRRVSAALIWAARRGVTVRVLLDGFGAGDLPRRLRLCLERGGVQLLFFRPERWLLSLDRHRLRRMHRKVVVLDGRMAFVGGINILDDVDRPDERPRYDYALRVEGPVVEDLRRLVAREWRSTAWSQLRRGWRRVPPLASTPGPAGPSRAALVVRDNVRHRRAIEAAYLRAIAEARDEIIIANAGFLPGRRFRAALLAAAERGVRVILLLQGRVETALQHFATQLLYGPLLAAGVAIHEYQAGFIHAKVAVVDGEWMTVGSSNLDPFSLLTAREANLLVRDRGLAGLLRRDLLRHIQHEALPVTRADQGRQPWWRAALPWLSYQLVRILLGVTGYGGKDYLE